MKVISAQHKIFLKGCIFFSFDITQTQLFLFSNEQLSECVERNKTSLLQLD